MRVVLSGYFGFHNIGDEAILYSMIRALKEVDPSIEIVVLSNDPTFTAKQYGVEAVNRWKIGEVMDALRSSDGLISGGGSLLQDKTGGKSVIYYTGVMHLAKMLRKPIFIYAQGMGPIDQKKNQWLTKFALNRVNHITVRDEDSRKLLKKMGVTKKIDLVPDPVIALADQPFHNEWFEQQNFTLPVITVSVRNWPSNYPFEEEIADALDKLARRNFTIVFLPMHGIEDDEASRRVLEKMQSDAYIAPYDMSVEEKIGVTSLSHFVVGMRLHALIFATITNTPFVAISYDPKIDAFSKQTNQPVAFCVNEPWQKGQLFTTIEHHIQNVQNEKARLAEFMKNEQQKAMETATMAINTFKNG